ncbi:ATP-dependent DNA ligase [Trueperella sp.]|uniref:ATP-dependent DNA ligase n=1 Tax=Trueperella sp. TaxID=2699835 RepID=UPI00373625BA
MARSDRKKFRVGNRSLSVSSLDKVLYPATGTTKAEVMHYCLAVADVMLPMLRGRPITRKRWVDGVGTPDEPGDVFFRKDLEDSAPDWIPTGNITHKSSVNSYPVADEPAVLAWFAQVAALELHTPQWRFGRNGQPRNPDRLVLDLDPGEGVGLAECAEVARWCREILDGMDMETFPVTSGSKGIHLYASLDGTHNSDVISTLAKEIAKALEADHPDLVVSTMKKSNRAGKVFVDWSQNSSSKTTVSPYSLRGRFRPTVAAPRTWEELDDPDLAHLDMQEVLDRIAEGVNPIEPLALDDDGLGSSAPDRLTTYRSMRDAAKTSEPVPDAAPVEREFGEGELPSFVIQEHHARRLHWDFRLEHSGVLVSWAVPKGPPLEHDVNRLAVMTEDHPLEYGTFEGTIAKGEYGAGEVTIWDTGVFELEKWREGKEVIAVLHGRPDGGLGGVPRRFALINAPGMGEKKNWLIRLMNEQPDDDDRPAVEQPAGDKPAEQRAKPANRDSRATESSRASLPFGVGDLPSPMLAKAGKPADVTLGQAAGEKWAFEMKWDGYRVIAGVQAGGESEAGVVLSSRNGKDLTDLFPGAQELAGLLQAEAAELGGAVFDGELVALDDDGRPNFGLLQAALRDGEDAQLRYMVFDVLSLGPPHAPDNSRRSLLRTPYDERRAILTRVLADGDSVVVPPAHHGKLAQAERVSRELGLEGVVAKRRDSVYLPDQRGSAWIKLKFLTHQEIVVVGVRSEDGTSEGRLKSLLVAIPDDKGELRYAGRVGSGFSQKQIAQIHATLKRIERKTPPVSDVPEADQADAWWVTPKLVAETSIAGRTRDRRLRHAVWRGWREDKNPDDVRWESPLGNG